ELKKDSKEVEAKAEVKVEAKAESCQAQRRRDSWDRGSPGPKDEHHRPSTGGSSPPPPGRVAQEEQCKVLFDYAPQNQDELELKVGELVDINEEVDRGWWSGSVNGKSGLFPSNFVKELEEEDTGDIAVTTEETDGKDLSTPTSPGSATGNGGVAQPKKVLGFGFGDIFREGSVKLRPRPPSPDKEERKDKLYTGTSSVRTSSVRDQLYTDQLYTDQLFTDQLYTDHCLRTSSNTDQLFTDQLYTGSCTDQLYTGQLCTEPVYTDQLYTDQLYTDQLYTGQLCTDQLYTGQLYGKDLSTPTSPGSATGNGGVAQPKKVLGFGFGDIFREGSVKLRPRPPSPDKEERKDK
ncbi:hypothetical protein CRUP_029345, partial [Coryphaenoides rupestris]